MANNLPVAEDTKEFEVIKVEGEEPKFGKVLEFIFKSRSAMQIIDFIRSTYELSEEDFPIHSQPVGGLENYSSVEFDKQSEDGQELFNIYSPQASTDLFNMSDIETIFKELSELVENETDLNVSFLLVSFSGEKDFRPERVDVVSIPNGIKFDQQNLLVKSMEGVLSASASKLLALKIVKPKI